MPENLPGKLPPTVPGSASATVAGTGVLPLADLQDSTGPTRLAQWAQLAQCIEASGLELVRFAWCDVHGTVRAKALTAQAAVKLLKSGAGLGMVGTLMLKDTSDRTAFKVFEPGIESDLPGFAFGSNVLLTPLPDSFRVLPWAHKTGWIQCQAHFPDGSAVPQDSRLQLQRALQRLDAQGLGMVCGLEIEFHIYRLKDTRHGADLAPELADWPGPAPEVSMVHPGYQLLSEHCLDQAEEPLRIVQHTAQALGLPLLSLEIEMGPSQVEAVFEATDALRAADNMVLFRSAVRQALRRAGYHATFMCRPPFDHVMSSGWHLHQSLVQTRSGCNAFMRTEPAPHSQADDALHTLSDLGAAYLAGLLHHAPGMTPLCCPTANGFGRFRPHALAPQAVLWGRDNRGAMLRVIGQAGDAATRIENRLGESAANPYLYMAAQIHAGLRGIHQNMRPPPATHAPYADAGASTNANLSGNGNLSGSGQGGMQAGGAPLKIPSSLGAALTALQADVAMQEGFGADFVRYFCAIKGAEQARFEAAADQLEFQRREYFGRI